MAFFRLPSFLVLLLARVCLAKATNTSVSHTPGNLFNLHLPANPSTDISPGAAYYRNVSAGAAWVVPSSSFDLGARGMSCECFDPDEQCCMPTSTSIAPFCIPLNSTCCADTFCSSSETCCGDSCCPSDATCSPNPVAAGCCPKIQTCSGPAICYDHSSTSCTNTYSPQPQCCPANLPYCRNFAPYGLGCFAYPSLATNISSIFAFPSIISHSFSTTSSNISTSYTESTILTAQLSSALPLPLTTATEYLSIIPLDSGGFSIQYSSLPEGTGSSNPLITTGYALTFISPSGSLTPTLSTTNRASSFPPPSPSTKPVTSSPTSSSSSSSSSISSPSHTTTSLSALCFNIDYETPLPCPSSASSKPTISSVWSYSPPGTSVVSSRAISLSPPATQIQRSLRSAIHNTFKFFMTLQFLAGFFLGTWIGFFIAAIVAYYALNDPRDGEKQKAGTRTLKVIIVKRSGRKILKSEEPGWGIVEAGKKEEAGETKSEGESKVQCESAN